jgi:hypothetical protein
MPTQKRNGKTEMSDGSAVFIIFAFLIIYFEASAIMWDRLGPAGFISVWVTATLLNFGFIELADRKNRKPGDHVVLIFFAIVSALIGPMMIVAMVFDWAGKVWDFCMRRATAATEA